MPLVINPFGSVDPACPINWAHPLNVGLVADWTCVPNGGWGGLTMRDLVRSGHAPHDGTLTNGPLRQGAKGRPGGFGSIAFTGASNHYISVPRLTPAAFTLTAWVRQIDQTASYQGIYVSSTPKGLYLKTGRLNYFQSSDHLAATTIALSRWYHVACTFDGTTMTFYLDAKSDGTSAFAATLPSGNGGIGSESTANSYTGSLDAVRIYNRMLSAANVSALFEESRRGSPELYNRMRPVVYFLPVGGVQFDAAGNSGFQAASSDYTFNVVVASNSDRYIDFAVELLAAGSVTAVTHDNLGTPVSAVQISSQAMISGAGKVEWWRVVAPVTGTKQVRVQLSAAIGSVTGWGSWYNVHQTSPTEGVAGSNGVDAGAGTVSLSITSTADQCVIRSAIVTDDTAITSGQTERNNVSQTLVGSGADESFGPQSPGAKSMTWAGLGIGASHAELGYAIRPSDATALGIINHDLLLMGVGV